MLMDLHPSQQHAGLHRAVWQLQQEVTRLKARFKPTSPKKSGVDGGANQVPTYVWLCLLTFSLQNEKKLKVKNTVLSRTVAVIVMIKYYVIFKNYWIPRIEIRGQYNKQFTLIIYDSRVVIWGIFKLGTTLES